MFFVIAAFVLGFFVKLLWNALIPDIFHGPEIGYLQAVGLLVLARLLAGFRAPRPFLWHLKKWGPPWTWRKRGWSWHKAMHDPYMRDYCGEHGYEWWHRWKDMNPEERQAAKEKWKDDFRSRFEPPAQ